MNQQTTTTASDIQELHHVECITSKLLSTKVTIIYGSVYSLLFVIVSIYSFNYLMQFDSKFKDAKAIKRLKMWMLDIYKRRRCYVPIAAHVFDQITDVAVAIQFYQLAQTDADCNELNIWSLFILTVLSMVIYRAISSFLIYKNTQSLRRTILQILDLQLFEALYINYICDKTEPSDPQRWITLFEAAFESTPQTVIQLVFLIKTGSSNASFLIIVSLLSSFWSIISKVISDDKIIVTEASQRLESTRKHMVVSGMYISRVVWRVSEVSNHILVIALLWISVGGLLVGIGVALEFVIILYISHKTNQWQLLFGLVALMVSVATPQLHKMSKYLFVYKTVTMLVGCIIVSRYLPVMRGLVIYIWNEWVIATLFSFFWLDWDMGGRILQKGKSTSRDLKDMIQANNQYGILEMQLFKHQFAIYDEKKQMTLLMLAMKLQIPSAIIYILNNVNADYLRKCDVHHCNVLDYLCLLYTGHGGPMRLVEQILYKIYEIDPQMVGIQNKKNGNSLLLYIESARDLLNKLNIRWTEDQIKWFNKALLSLNASLLDKTIIKNALNVLINDLNIKQFEYILNILETQHVHKAPSTKPANTLFKFVECKRQSGLLYCFGHEQINPVTGIQIPNPISGLQTFIDNCVQISTCGYYGQHSLFLDDLGRVYAFGYNRNGELGTVIEDSSSDAQYCNYDTLSLLTLKTPHRAKQVGAGMNHSLVLMENGNIWSFGLNTSGQLGHNDDVEKRLKPKMIESIKDQNIVYISCGSTYNCIIEQNGKIFAFGSSHCGQCGFYEEIIKIPTEIDLSLKEDKVLTVKCGHVHTLILTINGEVISYGYHEDGRLGHGSGEVASRINLPRTIDSLKTVHVVDVSCGASHSLCVDGNGTLYSWGDGKLGQLGHGYDYKPTEAKPKRNKIVAFFKKNEKEEFVLKNHWTPKVVEFFKNQDIKIVKCCAGNERSSVIADNGDLYVFGRSQGDYAQLMPIKDEEKQETNPIPIKVAYFNNVSISSVSLGQYHSAVITGKPRMTVVVDEEKKEEENQMEENKSYDVWVKNDELLGYEWMLMGRNIKRKIDK